MSATSHRTSLGRRKKSLSIYSRNEARDQARLRMLICEDNLSFFETKLGTKIYNIDYPDNLYNETLLHEAAYKALGGFEFAKLIIGYRANLNSRNHIGQTPLHIAARNQFTTEVSRLLIANGADVNAMDIFGNTPLHVALHSLRDYGDYKGDLACKSCAIILISRGANLFVRNQDFVSPFDFISHLLYVSKELFDIYTVASSRRPLQPRTLL